MTNEIIYKGLELKSLKGCKYFNVVEGTTTSLVEDTRTSTLTLTYIPGNTSESLANFLGLKSYGDPQEMTPTGKAVKFKDVTVSLNGLVLKKMTYDPHVIHMVIVRDSESRVVQNYNTTTLVISSEDYENEDFINFLFYSGNLIYLKAIGKKPKCYKIRNFPKILVKDSNLTLESDSKVSYVLRRSYDDYVIRAIDYQNQFVLELRRILDEYGIEFVRWNKEETLTNTSYISYQFNQTPTRIHHPNRGEEDRVMQQRLPVDFTLRTPDMVMFFDFKNKYNNVDLLTNFCEFRTSDRYGERWTAAVKWQQITEDFNHNYQQDDNANFSYQCQFRAELYFYEVLDERYKFLEEIQLELDNSL